MKFFVKEGGKSWQKCELCTIKYLTNKRFRHVHIFTIAVFQSESQLRRIVTMNQISSNLIRIPSSVIALVSRLIDQVSDNMVELSSLSINHEYINVKRHLKNPSDFNLHHFPFQPQRKLVRVEISPEYRNSSNDEF